MVETATGLVLRTHPLTETSLIVQWLTRNHGRLATVAKAARRPQSPFHGKLDLFYLADFSFSRSRHSALHTLREVTLRDPHKPLRLNLSYLEQVSYCATLIEQVTETDTPLEGIFELLNGLLNHLPAQPTQARTIFSFELKLLHELGLSPDPSSVSLKSETKTLLKALEQNTWSDLPQLNPSRAQVSELNRFLHGFLIYHLGKIPPGRQTTLAQKPASRRP
ncbi:MAG TPA: DNA repair protein RecO [Candidatus Limnocylindrales bacterium]|nr:DNA repair protein RecO [Candidatus Limnocylindrales bacterium]